MKRALLALLVTAVGAPSAFGATTPTWTAQGVLTKLNARAITVYGHSCRLEGSYGRFVAIRYDVGDWLKILCRRGVLEKVAVLPKPAIKSTPAGKSGGPTFSVSGADIVITAIDATTITVNTPIGGTTYVCTVGPGSPNIVGLKAGDRLRDVGCVNGTLTELTRIPV